MNKIGLDYHSRLSELNSDRIDMINLGQEEDATSHETMPYDNQGHQHQSELKVATVDHLKQLCL